MSLPRRGRSALLVLLLWPALLAAATGRELSGDLDYYRRVSDGKNLGANDRLYILYRLQGKYAGSGVDLSALEGEITRWEEAKKSGVSPAAAPKPKIRPAAAARGRPGSSDGAGGPALTGLRR